MEAGQKAYISVDLEGSDSDMRDDLRQLLRAKYQGGPSYCYCSIVDVWTKDKYFIYEMSQDDGTGSVTTGHWKQAFKIGKDEEPTLDGDPVSVMIQFVPGVDDADKAVATKAVAGVAGADNGLISRVRGMFAALGGSKEAQKAFWLTKDVNGRTRFFCVASNNYEDREDELFTAEAHKSAIDWYYSKDGSFPELRAWHTKEMKFGQVDWADYVNGLVVGSGLIDQTPEATATAKALDTMDTELAMSHGFLGYRTDPISTREVANGGKRLRHWTKYLDYEWSVLPRAAVANFGTAWNFIKEVDERMPFSPERKAFLGALGADPAKIDSFEKAADTSAQAMAKLGLSSKGLADMAPVVEGEPAPAGEGAPAALPEGMTKQFMELLEASTKAMTDATTLASSLKEQVATLTTRVETAEAAAKAAADSAATNVNDKVAAALTPRPVVVGAGVAHGSKAAGEGGTAAERQAQLEQEAKDLGMANNGFSFFGDVIGRQLGLATNGVIHGNVDANGQGGPGGDVASMVAAIEAKPA